ILPALQGRGQEIKLGEDVAEARRYHFVPLEAAAEREQGDIDGERKRRAIASQLAIETARISCDRSRCEHAAGPVVCPRAQGVDEAVADVPPKRAVEGVEAAGAVGVMQRRHFLQNIRMAADRALTELNKGAGDDVRTLDRDSDRHRTIKAAEV